MALMALSEAIQGCDVVGIHLQTIKYDTQKQVLRLAVVLLLCCCHITHEPSVATCHD
jgi:hypothetical protein